MLHIKLLFKRFAWALALFEICRVLFLLFNLKAFSSASFLEILSTFWYGLLFDISALVYINILFIILHIVPNPFREKKFYQWTLRILFVITNGVGIFLNFMDFGYFHFSGKRTGSEILKYVDDIKPLIAQYLRDYWYLALLVILFFWMMYYFYPVLKQKDIDRKKHEPSRLWLQLLLLPLILVLSVIGARGGFYLKPIRPFDAVRYVKPELVPLVLNTPFQIFTTIENPRPEVPVYMPDKKALTLFSPEQQYPSSGMKKLNVVIIILESFGKEYVGYFNEGKGYTPFLDSLCGQSMVFMDAYANGKHSIDAVPSILCGIPSLLEMPYIDSYYQGDNINSIGKILRDVGYSTAFYHGAHNGTMGFDNFIRLSQFGPYYGLNEYPIKSDVSGEWGIPDEPYLQYVDGELNKKAQPFCVAVFTLSSHHPYTIPEKYKGKFPEGTHPIHKSIGYADYSLKEFFEKASRQSWYKNTLFVLTADHTADNQTPLYQTFKGRYSIPIIFYRGDGSLKEKNYKTIQQTDITPGILDYLGYGKKFTAFGHSPFDSTYSGMAVQYENATYQFVRGKNVFHFDGKSPVAFYNSPPDSFLRENLVKNKISKSSDSLESSLKAYIQLFHERLDKNKMR